MHFGVILNHKNSWPWNKMNSNLRLRDTGKASMGYCDLVASNAIWGFGALVIRDIVLTGFVLVIK